MTMSVLMIGYGAIATYVARRLADDAAISIDWVLARAGREDSAASAIGPRLGAVATAAAIEGRPDVALECAGHGALLEHGPALLERGIPLAVASVGALSDDGLAEKLERAAKAGGTHVDLLSGAIGAVDAISAAREGGLDRVTYTSRKPPASWQGTPAEELCDLGALAEPYVFYRGTAREAARRYPKNANVAATIALAGLGLDATEVALTADPTVTGNVHRVEAAGAFGRLDLEIEGRPLPDNPKSSALTAMSCLRYLRNRARAIRM